MPAETATGKDPSRVRAGRARARQRWGPEPRIIRLDDCSPPERRLVLSLLEAIRRERAAAGDGSPSSTTA